MTVCKAELTKETEKILESFSSELKELMNSGKAQKEFIELSDNYLKKYTELEFISGKWTPLWVKEEAKKVLESNKKQRGGKRTGAGRPKKEKTELVRVPVSLIPIVNELKKVNEAKWEDKEKINEIITMLKNRSNEEQLNLI